MSWYWASLQMFRADDLTSLFHARRCQYLIEASDHEAAHRKSIELGNRLVTKIYAFGGVYDLLLVYDAPKDGSELLWSELELTPEELENECRQKDQLQAFVLGPSSSGWYVGSVVLREIHDEGSHGERFLIWINSYLIASECADDAYARVLQIGREQQDNPGSHRCAGEKAHWEFWGIQDIIPMHERPADGSLLWCSEFRATAEQLKNMVPKKSDLSVFIESRRVG